MLLHKANSPRGCSEHRAGESPLSSSSACADGVVYFILAGGEGFVCLKELNVGWVAISNVLKITCLAQENNQTPAFR